MSKVDYVLDSSCLMKLNREQPVDLYPSVWERIDELITAGRAVLPKEAKRGTDKKDHMLVPYAHKVCERYAAWPAWLARQEQSGVQFSDKQRWWLARIAQVTATSARVTADDLEDAPFAERGGAIRDLGRGADVDSLIRQLNSELTT